MNRQNMRLYDACQVLGVSTVDTPVGVEGQFRFHGWSRHPQVFVADEIAMGFVAELVEASREMDQSREEGGGRSEQDDDHYQGVVPPYDVFMVEARMEVAELLQSGLISVEEGGQFEALAQPRCPNGEPNPGWVMVGASVSAMNLSEEARFKPGTRSFINHYRNQMTRQGRWMDPKWLYSVRTIAWAPQLQELPVAWTSIHLVQVDENGDERGTHSFTVADDVAVAIGEDNTEYGLSRRSGGEVSDVFIWRGDRFENPEYVKQRLAYAQLGVVGQSICMRTLEFLGAVNVETRDHTSPLGRQQRRQLGRIHGEPYEVVYKTLDVITGSGRTARRRALTTLEGASHEAAHMVRGHLKTYTEEAPLFGRHVGTWFWPPHVRGSEEGGVVVKDYRLREHRS